MYMTMAIHYPRPEHRGDFLAFMARVEAGMAGVPGLLGIESWREGDGDRLFAIGRWESEAAFAAGLPTLLGVGGRDPSWSARPDDLVTLHRA